jgi:outer membrane protein OmpA-like peptidoglycan-associated protein
MTPLRCLGLAFALGSGTLACAHDPPAALVDARTSYQQAASDPLMTQAPVPLHEAEQALDRANRAFAAEAETKEVEHLSYLAGRRVEIARELALRSAARKETEHLGEERRDVLLEARTREAEALAAQLEELQAKQTERGIVLTLGDVFFDVDRAELKPGAQHNLYRLVEFMKQNPDRSVVIEGHTDSTGSPGYNLDLSQRRAESVRRFLERQGIESSRIGTRGYGLDHPIASNDTMAGRQQNRRVEIVILEPSAPASAADR